METDEMKKGLEEIKSSFELFKKSNDEQIELIKKTGVKDPLLEEKIEKINKHISATEDANKKRLEALELSFKRPAKTIDAKGNELPEDWIETKDQYSRFIRKGINADGSQTKEFSLDKKSLSVQSDPDGGYTVHADMSGRIVSKVFESSPIRAAGASVVTISSDRLEGLIDTDEMTSGWVSEKGSRTETATAQLGKWSIPVHELYASPRITQKLLDDSSFNAEAWISGKVAEKFARDENTSFVTGSGTGKPRGFTTYATGTTSGTVEQINAGSVSTFTADGLMSLVMALKEPYRSRAKFGFTRAGVALIRKLKGTQNDHYMWEPSLTAGQPSTLLGAPVIEMADLATITSASLSGVFADWAEFYTIVERVGVRVIRDPYTAKPYVEFYTTKRVGGAVTNGEAGKLQIMSV